MSIIEDSKTAKEEERMIGTIKKHVHFVSTSEYTNLTSDNLPCKLRLRITITMRSTHTHNPSAPIHIMQNSSSIHFLLLNLALLLPATSSATAILNCPNCGTKPVPFPLSTSPACGSPFYKVRCTKGTLWFDALNGSSYVITSITPKSQQLIIHPPGFNGSTCITTDYHAGGLWLDEKLPFNISSDNTVLKLNCQPLAFISAMNCSSSSICFRYMKEKKEVASRCKDKHICCSFTGGGSQNDHNIKLAPEKCAVYTSFVGLSLNTPLPVSKWPKPGIAINWVLPPEPVCSTDIDCKKLPKSSCVPSAVKGPKRCLCKVPYKWDPIKGACSKVKCETSKCRRNRKRKKMIAALTYTGGIIAILGSFAILVYIHLRRIKRKAREQLVRERQQILNANNSSGRSAKLFSAKEIRVSTGNFSKENVLGSGGFGEVYKGILQDGTIIAVKRAIFGNTKGNDQVLNEVRILCQVNHRSLVRLLGCCVELEEPVLVYEYISNGTLYDRLHVSCSNDHIEAPLNWNQRLAMARQIAEGLTYLHFSSVPPIIHRDIKTSNILLNEKLDIKISDFGLSRIVDNEATHMTTCAQGTLGYLDPQYYRDMQLTDKSDVYSFGVVLLELLTTRKAIDFSREVENVSLVSYMRKMVNQQKLLDAVDPFLEKGASKLELETMKLIGILAISCLDEQRHNRPSMSEVKDEIEYMLHIIEDKGAKYN